MYLFYFGIKEKFVSFFVYNIPDQYICKFKFTRSKQIYNQILSIAIEASIFFQVDFQMFQKIFWFRISLIK